MRDKYGKRLIQKFLLNDIIFLFECVCLSNIITTYDTHIVPHNTNTYIDIIQTLLHIIIIIIIIRV